jgi:hypothetical protein
VHLDLARVVSPALSVALLLALERVVSRLAHRALERVALRLVHRALERVVLTLAHLAPSVDLLLDLLRETDRAVLRLTQLAPHLAPTRVTTRAATLLLLLPPTLRLLLPPTLLAPLLTVPAALLLTTPRPATVLKRKNTSPPYDQVFSCKRTNPSRADTTPPYRIPQNE